MEDNTQTVSFSLEKVVSMLIAKQLSSLYCEIDKKIKSVNKIAWSCKYTDVGIFYKQNGISHRIFMANILWDSNSVDSVVYETNLTCDCKEKTISCVFRHSNITKPITCKSQFTGQSILRFSSWYGHSIILFNNQLGYYEQTELKQYLNNVDPEQVFNIFREIATYYFHNDPYNRPHNCEKN